MSRYLVLGAGPIGSGVALRLAREGHAVTVATRSGRGPDHPGVERAAIDAGDPEGLSALATGAAAIFNCLNPPYSRWAEEWPPLHRSILTAAERSDAVIVMTDNLYSFGPDTAMPLHEGDPMTATGTKGGTRRRMTEEILAAHAEGRVRATLARASDFFGPTVSDSSMGSRVVPRVLAGRKVSVLGRSDIPHSASYVDDVVRTLVTIATDERAWGRPWHVPSTTVSQSDLVTALAHAAATSVRVTTVPRALVNVAGVAVPFLRELRETWYQFAEPWVIDSTLTEQTFGLSATPLDDAARATVAWWAERA